MKSKKQSLFPVSWLQAFAIILFIVLAASLVVIGVLYAKQRVAPSVPNPVPSAPAADPVEMTIITAPECAECFDASLLQPQLEQLSVEFKKVTSLAKDDAKAKALIAKYAITKLPAFLLSDELSQNAQLAEAWSRVGTVADDGSYVLQGAFPPYYDLVKGEVRGLVTLTEVSDASCTECYDVTMHEAVLGQFGFALASIEAVDVATAEGEMLVAKYDLTQVPTIILSADAGLYAGFAAVWESVGTVEEDGSFVFRTLSAIGEPYKDLTTGVVVTPTVAATPE